MTCLIDAAVLEQPGGEHLAVLTKPQAIGLDDTILVPYVGSVHVEELRTSELELLLQKQLGAFFSIDLQIQVRASREGK